MKTVSLYNERAAWTSEFGFYHRETTDLVGKVVYDDTLEDRTVLRNPHTNEVVATRYEGSAGDWIKPDGTVTNWTLRAAR